MQRPQRSEDERRWHRQAMAHTPERGNHPELDTGLLYHCLQTGQIYDPIKAFGEAAGRTDQAAA